MRWFSQAQLSDPAVPWIAVRTRARSEKRIAHILSNWGVESWAPTAPLRRKWSDRYKVIEWPLFPGYLFARIPVDGWYPLLELSGVQTVVKDGKRAAVIGAQTLHDVRAFVGALGRVETVVEPEYVPWWEPGDIVVVTDGPFAGVRATVTEVDGRRRVAIGMTLLGRGVSVTIPPADLARASAA